MGVRWAPTAIPAVAASATLRSRRATQRFFAIFARPNARHCQGINPTSTATTPAAFIAASRVIALLIDHRVPSGILIAIQDARVALGPSQPLSSARLTRTGTWDNRSRHTGHSAHHHHPDTHVNHIARARYMYCHTRDAEPPAPRVGTLRAQAKGL